MENVTININDLLDWEKSQIFALLTNRLVEDKENPGWYGLRTWRPLDGGKPGETWTEYPVPNFYALRNLQNAHGVLQWWRDNSGWNNDHLAELAEFFVYLSEGVRKSLDLILVYAIENEMVDWQKVPFAIKATA